jgi:uncharacterized repeat protein (TIGR03803 family)
MADLRCWKQACAVFLLCAAAAVAAQGQTFTTLVNFDGTNGANPQYGALVQWRDGTLYGTTVQGGNNWGTVFKINTKGTVTTLYSFCPQPGCADGSIPNGLVLAADGNFYGTTYSGGTNDEGTVFRMTPGGKLTTLHSFDGTDGANPYERLVQGVDGNFYGTAALGGNLTCGYSGGCGTVFRINSSGTITTLYTFCSKPNCADGAVPYAGLIQGTDGDFYGAAGLGGNVTCNAFGGCGTLFRLTRTGKLTTLYTFCPQPGCADGSGPFNALVQAADGSLYGTTWGGGDLSCFEPFGCGTVFTIVPGGALKTLHTFEGSDGFDPQTSLIQATDGNFYATTLPREEIHSRRGSCCRRCHATAYLCPYWLPIHLGVNCERHKKGGMHNLSWWKKACAMLAVCAATAIAAQAQVFNYVSFDGPDGANPSHMAFVQGADGGIYGTTEFGGLSNECSNDCGTIFEIASGATPKTLYSFCTQSNCGDGDYPYSELILAPDGSFYGTTQGGGVNGQGTVFEVTAKGTLTILYSFCAQPNCADGSYPFAGLALSDGNFYGTTVSGGSYGYGVVFKITPAGQITTVHNFNSTDGAEPQAMLIQATDGNFYGTTSSGGTYGFGTVFKITPRAQLTTLHNFKMSDGSAPIGGLVQATDGNLYGTTYSGGANNGCFDGCGTIFKIAAHGAFTTLHSFDGADGAYPSATLVQGTDGNLYGTAASGGNPVYGTVFKTTLTGTLTTLHAFDNTDGFGPEGGLLQATSGKFYGTTYQGGDFECHSLYGCGTAYSLDMGLSPFVAFVQAAGKVGQTGGVLGQGFTGTTAVAINGVPANFRVVSDTYLTATVPAGATTGYVTVTTPSGTLTSNVPFRVIP